MNEKFNMRFLNRLMYIGFTSLIVSVTIWVLNEIGVIAIVFSILGALFPVLLAIAIAYMLEPWIQFLGKRKIKRVMAVPLIYLFLALILVAVIVIIVPAFINQTKQFLANLPDLVKQVEAIIKKMVGENVNIDLEAFTKSVFSNFSSSIMKYLFSLFGIFYTVVIAITGSVFLSLDFPYFKSTVKKIVPSSKRDIIYPFFHDFLPIIHKYVSVVLLNVFLLFCYSTLILFLFGVPFPALFALVIALTKLIPVIGSYLGAIPLILVGFAVSLERGLLYLGIILIIQFIESNIVSPIVVRGQMKIKPIENLIGVAVLGKLFGFVGMIISPIIISGIKIALYQHRLRMEEKDPTLVNPGKVSEINAKADARIKKSD